MVVEHSGGQMEAGMKDNLEMEYKVVMVSYIEKVGINNMKDHGTMVCLMVRELNSFKMVKNIKELSSKINSMEKVYSTRMIQLFMEYGKIINCLL